MMVETAAIGGMVRAETTTSNPSFFEPRTSSVKRQRKKTRNVPKIAAGVRMAAVSEPVSCSDNPPRVKFAAAITQATNGPLE